MSAERMSADNWEKAGLHEMLQLVSGNISARKLDLFNNWCLHVLWPYLTDRRSMAAARYADQHVDEGWHDTPERGAILQAARQAVEELERWYKAAPTSAEQRKRRVYAHAAQVAQRAVANDLPNRGVLLHAKITAYAFAWANDDARPIDQDVAPTRDGLRDSHLKLQDEVFRDIVSNPFRPVAFDSRWRTSDVVGLARGIYDEQAFSRLPILGDALMDAGCEEPEIIAHCRNKGPHVRGCWLVDLVLCKK